MSTRTDKYMRHLNKNVNWEGKQSLFYVRRIMTRGYEKFMTEHRRWASHPNMAQGFQTEAEAVSAARETGHWFSLCANRRIQ